MPLGGRGGGLGWGVVGGLQAVDVGLELLLDGVEIDSSVGVEGNDGVVLEDDAGRGGEALDVEDGEADALVGELGLGGFELAAPEAVETVGSEDVRGAFGVEVEGVATIEFDGHDRSHPVERNGSAE